ncbi:hypothetical protein BV898_05672 [Hypsibius exemplaris]|uniref:Uncharacterized protein n=1 Tax=Hypsibius exemplaris TaxID=2072580 RepID=A0A1W0WYZ6_HYPEX|nr:hypothetical protein BV898_05672 [Hypsibius exemplaris]
METSSQSDAVQDKPDHDSHEEVPQTDTAASDVPCIEDRLEVIASTGDGVGEDKGVPMLVIDDSAEDGELVEGCAAMGSVEEVLSTADGKGKSKRKQTAKPVKRIEKGDPSQAKIRAVRATRRR